MSWRQQYDWRWRVTLQELQWGLSKPLLGSYIREDKRELIHSKEGAETSTFPDRLSRMDSLL
jgi:hypothetical protein